MAKTSRVKTAKKFQRRTKKKAPARKPSASPTDDGPAPVTSDDAVGSTEPEIEMSPSIDKLAAALCNLQAEITGVVKDSQGYGYSYTSLAALLDALQKPKKKHGLALYQTPVNDGGSLGVCSVLMHASGQYIKSRFVMPTPQLKGTSATQNAGAAISYARRYAAAAIFGIASEDTDADYDED